MTNADKIIEIGGVLSPFTLAMRQRMTAQKNLEKRRWVECEPEWLEKHLQHQVDQMNDAMFNQEFSSTVFSRAVDVANVAMLLADAYKRGKR